MLGRWWKVIKNSFFEEITFKVKSEGSVRIYYVKKSLRENQQLRQSYSARKDRSRRPADVTAESR